MYLFFNVQRIKHTCKQQMWDKKAQTPLTLTHLSQAKWFGGCGLFKNA